jgi:Pre-mRNA splicing factor
MMLLKTCSKKDGSKLDWMYRGPGRSVDREQYLLGKAVDKPLEEQVKAEKTNSTSVVDSTSRMHPEYGMLIVYLIIA